MNESGRKEAWRKAHEATLQICRMASCGPEDERYELAVELVSASQSLVLALASEVDLDHVVDAASGSLDRLECLLSLAENLLSIAFVGLQITKTWSEPAAWPSVFGSVREGYGFRRGWSYVHFGLDTALFVQFG